VAKARRLIFTVTTPLGYRVILSRDRWREIIRFKHPALADHLDKVRKCLSQPEVVRSSEKDPDVHLYYLKADTAFVCAVVGTSKVAERFVITAYFTENIKKGHELWTR